MEEKKVTHDEELFVLGSERHNHATTTSIYDGKERINLLQAQPMCELRNYLWLFMILRHMNHMIKKHKINANTGNYFAPHNSLIIVFYMCVKCENILAVHNNWSR